MYEAQLIGLYTVREMPDELRPFLNLQAAREKRELRMGDKIVMLQVVGTSSYIASFLDTIGSVPELEERLRKQDTQMNEVTRVSLERLLGEKRNI